MAFPLKSVMIWIAGAVLGPAANSAAADERVAIGAVLIDSTEVTIGQFTRFAEATGLKTAAEAAGGGHEWGAGWERRAGWTFRTPFGEPPESQDEPAVHVSWHEARAYCAWANGRLPTRAEWAEAAYIEGRSAPPSGFATGQRYPYPTGESPHGANTRDDDPWPRHAEAGATSPGVNGLYDMGGNAWEWLAEREGTTALTAGGSWWYGADQMRLGAMQWKPADFYVVYIGFRCVYPASRDSNLRRNRPMRRISMKASKEGPATATLLGRRPPLAALSQALAIAEPSELPSHRQFRSVWPVERQEPRQTAGAGFGCAIVRAPAAWRQADRGRHRFVTEVTKGIGRLDHAVKTWPDRAWGTGASPHWRLCLALQRVSRRSAC